jgi:hypothetical protein
MKTYLQGNRVLVSVSFRAGGTLVDPDAVILEFAPPDTEKTTWQYGSDDEVVKDSTGRYHAEIDADTPGIWYYRWHSTGDGQAAGQGRFKVLPSVL